MIPTLRLDMGLNMEHWNLPGENSDGTTWLGWVIGVGW